MTSRWHIVVGSLLILLVGAARPMMQALPQQARRDSIAARTTTIQGLKLHYLESGRGPAIILLHGYTQTSRMWRPLMPRLAERFRVIAPDLPGIGESDPPTGTVTMAGAAREIHELMNTLGVRKAAVVGHDIGLMVAYAYAAQFPEDTEKLALMDAFLPGVDGWETIYDNPNLWHFRFHGATPEVLVAGRERAYFDYYWNEFAADRHRSISEADRQAYAAAYSRPGRMRTAWRYFESFPQTATEFGRFAQSLLTMPVLSIGGAKANGDALGRQAKRIASHAEVITLPDTGHWLMEERPQETADALVNFLAGAANDTHASAAEPNLRLTLDEIRASPTGADQTGSSGLPGVTTRIVAGNPSRGGFYTIILSVPANTTIPAHSHRDDRMATVLAGTWQFGYGHRFDAHALKSLPPGSVYSEPGGTDHFAQAGEEPVLVQISGVGPTDTKYVDVGGASKFEGR